MPYGPPFANVRDSALSLTGRQCGRPQTVQVARGTRQSASITVAVVHRAARPPPSRRDR
jgi:hypothetical protein